MSDLDDVRRAKDVCAEVGLEGAKLRLRFDIAHVGWECDSNGWVVEQAGKRHLILTNHGSPYIAQPRVLAALVTKYAALITATAAALDVLAEVPRKPKKEATE